MTIKDLQRIVLTSENRTEDSPAMKELLKRTRDKRFWWIGNEKERMRRHKETNGSCCFNHIIGLPKKAEKKSHSLITSIPSTKPYLLRRRKKRNIGN